MFEVKYEEIGRLMKEWEEIIRTKDHDRFAGLLWPEAKQEFADRKRTGADLPRTEWHIIFRDYYSEILLIEFSGYISL